MRREWWMGEGKDERRNTCFFYLTLSKRDGERERRDVKRNETKLFFRGYTGNIQRPWEVYSSTVIFSSGADKEWIGLHVKKKHGNLHIFGMCFVEKLCANLICDLTCCEGELVLMLKHKNRLKRWLL